MRGEGVGAIPHVISLDSQGSKFFMEVHGKWHWRKKQKWEENRENE